ncbi:hypothetical protein ABT234_04120 [Streptomyces sp. NPDC001586]|uniref:hypothetical protein n=1 Tax=Streptomyces sp. NPDC001586 TaxID=3154387 RepID=UPI00332700FC
MDSNKKIAVVKLRAHVAPLPWSAEQDPLGREVNGWEDGMALEDIYRSSRGIWAFDPVKVEACDHVLFTAGGLVRLIIELTGTESGLRRPDTGARMRAFVGNVVTSGPVYEQWFEKSNPCTNPNRRLLITYVGA